MIRALLVLGCVLWFGGLAGLGVLIPRVMVDEFERGRVWRPYHIFGGGLMGRRRT